MGQENDIVRGKGYWKFNNALLEDHEYVNTTKAFINEYRGDEKDNQLNWEMLKIKIKELTIRYCRSKNKDKKSEHISLFSELNDIDKYISANPRDLNAHEKRQQIKMKLELFEINKTRAAQVRSRAKFTDNWEKCSKLFLGLEKARANSKIMEQVYDDNGNILSNQQDIQNRQKQYFEDLYKK